jgi:hypothetical protein
LLSRAIGIRSAKVALWKEVRKDITRESVPCLRSRKP